MPAGQIRQISCICLIEKNFGKPQLHGSNLCFVHLVGSIAKYCDNKITSNAGNCKANKATGVQCSLCVKRKQKNVHKEEIAEKRIDKIIFVSKIAFPCTFLIFIVAYGFAFMY